MARKRPASRYNIPMDDDTKDAVYLDMVDEVSLVAPSLAYALDKAEEQRRRRLTRLLGGVRVKGLEEFLSRLKSMEKPWKDTPGTDKIAFLVTRAIYDFEVAFETGLSGYTRSCADAMRDTMEIELLLLDFYINPDNVDDWLGADRKRLINYYGPGALRKRIRASGLNSVLATERVESDYQAHSQGIHVSPYTLPDLVYDQTRDGDHPLQIDIWLSELFEHGRRVGNAFLLAAHKLAPESEADQATRGELPAFSLAFERTQEFVQPFLQRLSRSISSEVE